MKKRTKFLIECLEICSDYKKYQKSLDPLECLAYFCNAAAIIGYDDELNDTKQECQDAVELFDLVFQNDAKNYILDNNLIKIGKEYYSGELEDYLSDKGYFGHHSNESNQNHRLLSIALAAAISETDL